MEIQITDVSLFRRSIEALRDFLPQAQMHISSEGLRIRGMDLNHVGFVDYFLSSEDCKSLRAPRGMVLGISTTIFAKVLATASNAECVTLSDADDRLRIAFMGEGRSATFEIPTLDINEDTVELPELSYSAIVQARAADITGLIKDLASFGDSAILTLNENGFHVAAEGDMGRGELTLEPADDREMTVEGDEVKLTFGMKYLQQIVKSCSGLAATMEVAFDPGHPLRASSRWGNGSYFIAYLAPKVDEE